MRMSSIGVLGSSVDESIHISPKIATISAGSNLTLTPQNFTDPSTLWWDTTIGSISRVSGKGELETEIGDSGVSIVRAVKPLWDIHPTLASRFSVNSATGALTIVDNGANADHPYFSTFCRLTAVGDWFEYFVPTSNTNLVINISGSSGIIDLRFAGNSPLKGFLRADGKFDVYVNDIFSSTTAASIVGDALIRFFAGYGYSGGLIPNGTVIKPIKCGGSGVTNYESATAEITIT